MDTECQRSGYDDTGRYHVPPAAVSAAPLPELRYTGTSSRFGDDDYYVVPLERASTPHDAPDATDVPFPVQEWIFESLVGTSSLEVEDVLETYEDRIIAMARERFREGYAKFGSTMYGWSPERRLDEVLQELADALVYLTSGPVK